MSADGELQHVPAFCCKNKEIMTLLNSTLVIPWSLLEQVPQLNEKWGKNLKSL